MSQHDFVIDSQSAPAFRADLNGALAAIATTNSGTSAPSTPYANQLWVDTTNNQLKIRNEDNDAWIVLADLDQTGDTSAPPDASITFAKLAGAAVVTSSETIASNNNNTTIPTSAATKAYADAAIAAAVGGITSYTDAEARTAQAGHTAGGVGSYAFADPNASVGFGSTLAGSSLSPSGVSGGGVSATGSLSGTWRCMGYAGSGDFSTLWLRIS